MNVLELRDDKTSSRKGGKDFSDATEPDDTLYQDFPIRTKQ